ncbi:putative 6-phosphofructo-2-kinase/fructose-2,6-biphosphatase [Trypanosoma cruzi]|nr:putative 6-phosphofructo-2-kinase/fructose-2,6-biphosphatase [Trypanosoma cruzi]
MSVDANDRTEVNEWAVHSSVEPSDTPIAPADTHPLATAAADEARISAADDDERESRLLELIKGPIRPFKEWSWREAAYFKELREAENVEESRTNAKTEMTVEDTSAQSPETCGNPPISAKCSLARGRIPTALSCEAVQTVLSYSQSSRPSAIDSTLNVLTPLLDNYTIPITRQGPEHFSSDAQESVASLCIIMVGLPARGKTFLAQRICRNLGWHGYRAKVLNIQVAWRRLLLEYKRCHSGLDAPNMLPVDDASSSAKCTLAKSEGTSKKPPTVTCSNSERNTGITAKQKDISDPVASSSPESSLPMMGKSHKKNYVCAEQFRALTCDPESVERRLYRRVLERYAVDAKSFYASGGDVLVVNDDFITEELRDEAEALFSPLASQTFFMEVIRSNERNQKFNELKLHDKSEYPHDVNASEAQRDFARRIEYLTEVYSTLSSTCQSPGGLSEDEVTLGDVSREKDKVPGKTTRRKQRGRRYIKLWNSVEIEVQGVTGYTASRIVSYVMNLTQDKIQHPIFFVRHGESIYNAENRIGGDSVLSADGEEGANEILGFLASLKRYYCADKKRTAVGEGNVNNDDDKAGGFCSSDCRAQCENSVKVEVWTSQLRRAIQTVENSEPLLGIKNVRWSSLNEIHAGICEDLTIEEVRTQHPMIDHFRKVNKYTFRYPEGESYQDLVLRLEPVIMELENADRIVVVVAHQAVLRTLLAYFGSTSAESCVRLELPHRTIWRCTYDSKGISSLAEMKFGLQ